MSSNLITNFGADLIGKEYAQIADQALRSREQQIRELLQHRRLPVDGWDDLAVTMLLQQLAMADGNNQLRRAGVGEREGRVFSRIVAERNYHLIHGIGRSGDVTAAQPKAPGSSLLYALTQRLALHAVRLCGIRAASGCLVVPLATGMALSLCFSALRPLRPVGARFIILSRIDQGSCVKSIYHAGYEAAIVHMRQVGDGLFTDLSGIEATINYLREENVLCVVSTTSTFAPRAPDDVEAIAILCKKKNIPHIVNNAYGLQCSACCHRVERGLRAGRVDAFVQSTDKNFMTPVGGALICSADPEFLKKVAATYPGRASASPILDLFITLLQMGQNGLRRLLAERTELHDWFNEELDRTCKRVGLRVLQIPANKISTAVDLSSLERFQDAQHSAQHQHQTQQLQVPEQLRKCVASAHDHPKSCSAVEKTEQQQDANLRHLGSFLFHRRCSGLRVVCCRSTASRLALPSALSSEGGMPCSSSQKPPVESSQQPRSGYETQPQEQDVTACSAKSPITLLLPLQHACASHFPSFSSPGLQYLSGLKHNGVLHNSASTGAADVSTTPSIAVLSLTPTSYRAMSGLVHATGAEGPSTGAVTSVMRRVPAGQTPYTATLPLTDNNAKANSPVVPASADFTASCNATFAQSITGFDNVLCSDSCHHAPKPCTPATLNIEEDRHQCIAASAGDEAQASTTTWDAAANGNVAATDVNKIIPPTTTTGWADGALLPRQKRISGHVLSNWGSHCEEYPISYCTVAVAIGAQKHELETFLQRFENAVRETQRRIRRSADARTKESAYSEKNTCLHNG